MNTGVSSAFLFCIESNSSFFIAPRPGILLFYLFKTNLCKFDRTAARFRNTFDLFKRNLCKNLRALNRKVKSWETRTLFELFQNFGRKKQSNRFFLELRLKGTWLLIHLAHSILTRWDVLYIELIVLNTYLSFTYSIFHILLCYFWQVWWMIWSRNICPTYTRSYRTWEWYEWYLCPGSSPYFSGNNNRAYFTALFTPAVGYYYYCG
jgi:hypothetical protein